MTALTRAIERLLDGLATLAFLTMFALVVAQVVLRYVFNDPLVWSDEIAQYLFVWVAFLGVLRASRHRTHIAITAVIDRLPPWAARAMALFWLLAMAAFAGLLGWYGVVIARQNMTVMMTSLPLPYWLVYAIVPVTGAGLFLYAVRDIAALWRPAGAEGRQP